MCLLDPDGTERHVPAGLLRPGDMFVVHPGEAAAGDSVIGGTVALTGRLVVRAVKVGRDTSSRSWSGWSSRPRRRRRPSSGWRTESAGCSCPLSAGAALTLAGWLLADSPAGHAFSAGLAVLIIACPCAMGLATPAALAAACGRGARLGIFIKGYQALESSRAAKVVVLDKTGTVTTGRMPLAGVRPAATLSSVFVVWNSLRLQHHRIRAAPRQGKTKA